MEQGSFTLLPVRFSSYPPPKLGVCSAVQRSPTTSLNRKCSVAAQTPERLRGCPKSGHGPASVQNVGALDGPPCHPWA
jgi:hypothetical protein